jgi:alkanesulfonate monooxygenase SsuD/methylene tetrahydromethanopterin reductase-like flavin-dependent oxidoreductase (luciferase family)
VRLGAALPVTPIDGGALGPDSLADGARLLADLGYRSLWVFDAVGRGFPLPDPLMALTVAATVTGPQVELGTGVLQLPIRNPAEVAHRALTLRLVAGDRVLLGVGPGSTEADFLTFGGADFTDRFARFERQLAELRDWLADGTHGGRDLSPWPAVAGGPRLLVAGWRGRWVDRAAGYDGWIASGAYADDDTLADAIDRFRQAGGTRAVVTNVQVAEDPGPAIERLHRFAAMGFDDAVAFDLTPTEERLALVRREVA